MDGARLRAGDKIRGLLAEADREAAARLAEAEAALSEGRIDDARRLATPLVAGPRAADALALLDRTVPGGTRFASPPDLDGPAAEAAVPAAGRSTSARTVFTAVSLSLFVAIGTALAASWDGLIQRLGRAPSPQRATSAASVGVGSEDDVIGRARRLAASGRAGEALALLGSVAPEHPSYPLARQLRAQVAAAGHRSEGTDQ